MQFLLRPGFTVSIVLLFVAQSTFAEEKISNVQVVVNTTDDNKEDSQFEYEIRQGTTVIADGKHGAGHDWDDGDRREFNVRPNVSVTGAAISGFVALQDGPWGRNNTWNCRITITVMTTTGRQLVYNNEYAFSTDETDRDERALDSKNFP